MNVVVSADIPSSYDDVLNSDEYDLWKGAMDREINCLIKNQTWELVEKPKNVRILDLKWVFTNKSYNQKKARLVVKGFQQSERLNRIKNKLYGTIFMKNVGEVKTYLGININYDRKTLKLY